jgi:hypothetical protein
MSNVDKNLPLLASTVLLVIGGRQFSTELIHSERIFLPQELFALLLLVRRLFMAASPRIECS